MDTRQIVKKMTGAVLGLALTGSLLVAAPAPSAHAATASKASQVISFAEKIQNRVQYHFGVNNASKMWFDCSSFTKYVYKQIGVNLRWGARLQYADGVKIAKSQLRPGDLVFFSTPATAKNSTTYQKIGHVGIYIGNGKVIHNVSPKLDVIISDINKGWWNTHYVAAARVIKQTSASSTVASNSKTALVVRAVNFRTSPAVKSNNRIRYLQKGEKVTILSKVNKYWYKIKDRNGRIGYVTTMTKYINA